MKKNNLNIGVELTDEELLTMTGGENYLEYQNGYGGPTTVYPLYGIIVQPLYGIEPTPKYGIRPQPLYGITPVPEYGIKPLYGIEPAG